MLKKFTWFLILATLSVGVISFRSKFFSSRPPSNSSGAPDGSLCSNCHGNLNSGGGSVTVSGLPANFQAGKTYPFSVTISHGAPDRMRWGFAINAYNSNSAGIGNFTSANPNAAATTGRPYEIAHNDAVVTAASSSYTYTGLSWTAPATITPGDNLVTFYIAANAANNNAGISGDFIYSNTMLAVLPITLKNIGYKTIDDYKVQVSWATESENNSKEFVLEKSDDNNRFYEAGRMKASGSSSTEKNYSFTDARPSYFNKPVFYRLKLVDLDGKFAYSKVLQVVLKGKSTYVYSLSPNPATDFINVSIIADKNIQAEATIVSANGTAVARHLMKIQGGNNSYKIPVGSLSHGLYFFKFHSKEYSQNISFIAL